MILRPLLGIETLTPGPPCTVSVPNLNADRPCLVAGGGPLLNVRRLMYQPLIWFVLPGDEASGLCPALHSKNLKRAANALIHRVRRNAELACDFLGRKMLVDKQQAVELPLRQTPDPLCDFRFHFVRTVRSDRRSVHLFSPSNRPP